MRVHKQLRIEHVDVQYVNILIASLQQI